MKAVPNAIAKPRRHRCLRRKMPSRSRSDVSKFKRKRRTYRPCWKRSVCLGKLGLVCGLLYVAGLLLWQRARLALQDRAELLMRRNIAANS